MPAVAKRSVEEWRRDLPGKPIAVAHEMIVADGQTVMSHQLAERALQSLQNGALSR